MPFLMFFAFLQSEADDLTCRITTDFLNPNRSDFDLCEFVDLPLYGCEHSPNLTLREDEADIRYD